MLDIVNTALRMRNAKELVENIKYAMGMGRKPRKFHPKFYSGVKEFLSKRSLDELLKEIALASAYDETIKLLEGLTLKDWMVFPADLGIDVLYILDAKGASVELNPLYELLELAGRIDRKKKCVILLTGSIETSIPKDKIRKLVTYRNIYMKSCEELIFIGKAKDEKHILRMPKPVEFFRCTGRREDNSFKFLAKFSSKGKIDPMKLPALMSGGLLRKLGEIWEPLGKRFEIVKHTYSFDKSVEAITVGVGDIENGTVRPCKKVKKVSEKTLLTKGDVVVTAKGKEFRAGVIEMKGIFSVDPNVYGIKVGNVELAKALVEYLNFPVISRAIYENFCKIFNPPVLYDSLLLSLPVPPDLKSFSELLMNLNAEYEQTLKRIEERLKEKFFEGVFKETSRIFPR